MNNLLRRSISAALMHTAICAVVFSQSLTLRSSTFDMAGSSASVGNSVLFSVAGQIFIDRASGPTILLANGILADTLYKSGLTSAEGIDQTLPTSFSLAQNYPNPFNPSTTILYELSRQSSVTVVIFNILGQLVATLVSEEKAAGRYSVVWNGRTNAGIQAASGVYFYRIQAKPVEGLTDFIQTKKLILLK